MQNAVVRQMAILEPIHDHAQTLPVRNPARCPCIARPVLPRIGACGAAPVILCWHGLVHGIVHAVGAVVFLGGVLAACGKRLNRVEKQHLEPGMDHWNHQDTNAQACVVGRGVCGVQRVEKALAARLDALVVLESLRRQEGIINASYQQLLAKELSGAMRNADVVRMNRVREEVDQVPPVPCTPVLFTWTG